MRKMLYFFGGNEWQRRRLGSQSSEKDDRPAKSKRRESHFYLVAFSSYILYVVPCAPCLPLYAGIRNETFAPKKVSAEGICCICVCVCNRNVYVCAVCCVCMRVFCRRCLKLEFVGFL